MLNQVVLVGRLVSDPKIIETENERKKSVITLAVPRSFKNINGEYETDFIPCTLWQGIADSAVEYCKEGDLVGIKGKIQKIENKELNIVVEKLTFLSNKGEYIWN